MIIIPTKNGYFIGGIPHFQTYPYGLCNVGTSPIPPQRHAFQAFACEEFKEVPASQETLSVADAVRASATPLAHGQSYGKVGSPGLLNSVDIARTQSGMLVVQTHPFCWVQIQGGHSNGTRVFKGCTIDMWPTSPGFSNTALIKSNKPLGVAAGSRNHIFEVIDPNLIPNFHDPANSIFGSTGLLISAILTEVTRAFVSTWPPNAAAVNTLESSRPDCLKDISAC